MRYQVFRIVTKQESPGDFSSEIFIWEFNYYFLAKLMVLWCALVFPDANCFIYKIK